MKPSHVSLHPTLSVTFFDYFLQLTCASSVCQISASPNNFHVCKRAEHIMQLQPHYFELIKVQRLGSLKLFIICFKSKKVKLLEV